MDLVNLKAKIIDGDLSDIKGLAFTFRYVFIVDQQMNLNTYLQNKPNIGQINKSNKSLVVDK